MKASLLSLSSQILVLSLASSSVLASGFALIEQSASSQGNAYAGAAAVAEDASTVFFNPAGLTRVRPQLVAALHVIRTSASFTNSGTRDAVGNPIASGGNGGDAGLTSPVPNLYYAREVNEHLMFGLGVSAPYGLSTEYDPDWVGRYQGIKSELKTVNINPSLAYKAGSHLSLGAGISLQYAEADLTQAVDYGSLCGLALASDPSSPTVGDLPASLTTCDVGLGLQPQQDDGFGHVKGDDWSYGFNLGMLYEFSPQTRVGAAYRSTIKHTLKGNGSFTNAPAFFTSKNIFVPAAATAKLDTPETLSLSGYHELNSRWALMGDITWTRWSRFKELRIQYDSSQSDSVTVEDWDDTLRYSVGLNYRHSNRWLWRAGLAYDQTPIPSEQRRTVRIPGNDRSWLSVGTSYRHSDQLTLDLAFTHLFIDDTRINHSSTTAGSISGSYEADVNILSAQMVWEFQ